MGIRIETSVAGSPAWAGIDRGGAINATRHVRFPRVGGDRPARGRGAGYSSGGSPAWAGIDRLRELYSEMGGGFPRVGGDRPLTQNRIGWLGVVPPRGRG